MQSDCHLVEKHLVLEETFESVVCELEKLAGQFKGVLVGTALQLMRNKASMGHQRPQSDCRYGKAPSGLVN